jgi:hypothetical protein
VRLYLDEQLVIDNWTVHGPTLDCAQVLLSSEPNFHPIRLEYFEDMGDATIRLLWRYPFASSDLAPIPVQYLYPLPADACPDGAALLADGTGALTDDVCPEPPTCEMDPTTTLSDFGIVLENSWTAAEQSEILLGTRQTGRALCLHGAGAGDVVTAFRTVLQGERSGGGWRVIRFTRSSSGGVYCTTNNTPDNPDQSASIDCDTGVQMSQYTTVHEYGHVFVSRTSSGSVTYFGRVENPEGANQPLRDYQNQFVTGPRGWFDENNNPQTDWQRSDRITDNGWGSAALIPGPCDGSIIPPPGAPFPFQQNPCEVDSWLYSPGSPVRIAEVEEAAADMFLNWVYRMTTYDYTTNTWEGFLNALWRNHESPPNSGIILQCYPDGCSDEMGYPGDSRFEWMWNVLDELFAAYGWY